MEAAFVVRIDAASRPACAPSQAFFGFAFSAFRPPIAAAAPRPNRRTPPGAGTGVPPEVLPPDVLPPEVVEVVLPPDVVLPPEVLLLTPPEVDVVVVVVVEPPVDVDVLDDELFEDLLDLDDLEDLLDFEDFVLFVDLLLLLQKKKHLFDFELLLNQLVALASLGVAATTPAVAIEAPMIAACVILMYCIVSSPSLSSADYTTPRLTHLI